MSYRSGWLLAGLVCLPAPVLAAEAQLYELDPVHTRVVFAVEHAGFSRALGAISGSTGTVRFDRDDWRSAHVDVTVPLARIDLGDAKWNAAVLASNLLDAKRHPEARFVSNRIEPADATHARVCGELTLRGVTGPVCMDVTFNALKRHPLPPFRRTAGFSATAQISRSAFGISAWPGVIGDAVQLMIEAEAVRKRAEADSGGIEAAPEDPHEVESPEVETPEVESEPTDPDPVDGSDLHRTGAPE